MLIHPPRMEFVGSEGPGGASCPMRFDRLHPTQCYAQSLNNQFAPVFEQCPELNPFPRWGIDVRTVSLEECPWHEMDHKRDICLHLSPQNSWWSISQQTNVLLRSSCSGKTPESEVPRALRLDGQRRAAGSSLGEAASGSSHWKSLGLGINESTESLRLRSSSLPLGASLAIVGSSYLSMFLSTPSFRIAEVFGGSLANYPRIKSKTSATSRSRSLRRWHVDLFENC